MSVRADDAAIAIPVLPSLDLVRTREFYETQLGFTGKRSGDYLMLRRQSMEIHFWLTDDSRLPKTSYCFIRGGQVEALYEEYRRRRALHLSPFRVWPWNMKEFFLHDPHGNLLRFVSRLERIDNPGALLDY
jgi:catechol 2,3-dioxygenase-like lactoylglutathione lyase family enzyme